MVNLTSCGRGLIPPGVWIVRPRLLGFRRGGDGGLTKAGDNAGELGSSRVCSGKDVVEAALAVCLDVFTARFFKLRPFFGSGCFCNSKKGAPLSAVRGRSIPAVNVVGGGDSGEEPGEGSVALESSTVEIVVVGDDSLDPTVFVESLGLC